MKKQGRNWALSAISLAVALATSSAAMASTEAQKQAAIDSGLAWLATQQAANGSWCGSGYCAADTGSALLAFIEQKTKPGGWGGADYSGLVSSGLQYLMNTAQSQQIAPTKNIGTGGSPNIVASDMNGNGAALYWGGGEATYVTGLVLPALARATSAGLGITPTTVISSSSAATNGKTYATVIQDAADVFISGQTTQLNQQFAGARGGWRYFPGDGASDGSTAQWGAIGLTLAQQVPGVVVPQYVKDELRFWIDHIQSNSSGGAGYTQPYELVNESKTGGLLASMSFAGYNGIGGANDTGGVSNLAGALAFLNAHWKDGANGWDGLLGHPYAEWSVYKGLQETIGLNGTAISNFNYLGAAQIKDDPNDTWTWWEDLAQYLVTNQNAGGYWPGYYYWNAQLATAWSINILNATEVTPYNGVPEPASLALAGLALVGLAAIRRRKTA